MPDLHIHFQNMGLDASMYSSSWFLTLFSTMLPLELVNRIMDLFLCEVVSHSYSEINIMIGLPLNGWQFIAQGMEIVFRVSIAIMQLCRIDLLTLDMEGMLKVGECWYSLTRHSLVHKGAISNKQRLLNGPSLFSVFSTGSITKIREWPRASAQHSLPSQI